MQNKIQQRRNELGITQQDLADKLNISLSWMNKIETGKKIPTVPLTIRIADALETTVSNIFFD